MWQERLHLARATTGNRSWDRHADLIPHLEVPLQDLGEPVALDEVLEEGCDEGGPLRVVPVDVMGTVQGEMRTPRADLGGVMLALKWAHLRGSTTQR